MEKPYVVCHMLTSLDGKIDGSFFSAPETRSASQKYGELRNYFACNATLYGTTTMLGGYASGRVDDLRQKGTGSRQGDFRQKDQEDFIAPSDVQNYIISLDPEGVLAFDSPYSERKGRARAHIIEALTEKASLEYTTYLRNKGVSYLFAGKETFDCALLLHKLKTQFGIERLMIAGGGVTNWSFAAEGLVDELSIVVAPVADGSTESVSIFEEIGGQPHPPVSFTLKEAKPFDGDGVWLRYLKK